MNEDSFIIKKRRINHKKKSTISNKSATSARTFKKSERENHRRPEVKVRRVHQMIEPLKEKEDSFVEDESSPC